MSLLLPFTLATILTTDPLGYECVPEDRLEAAFAMGGKGMRAPQTCIPDPCAKTLTEVTLADYSGYRDAALYSDYRRRMSSVCGTPTVWEEKGLTDEELLWAVFDGDSGPIPLPEAGAPDIAVTDLPRLFETPRRDGGDRAPGRVGGFGGGGGGGSGGGGKGPFSGPGNSGNGPTAGPGPDMPPGPDPDPDLPSEVPLPAPAMLLTAALAALALVRRPRWGRRPQV